MRRGQGGEAEPRQRRGLSVFILVGATRVPARLGRSNGRLCDFRGGTRGRRGRGARARIPCATPRRSKACALSKSRSVDASSRPCCTSQIPADVIRPGLERGDLGPPCVDQGFVRDPTRAGQRPLLPMNLGAGEEVLAPLGMRVSRFDIDERPGVRVEEGERAVIVSPAAASPRLQSSRAGPPRRGDWPCADALRGARRHRPGRRLISGRSASATAP